MAVTAYQLPTVASEINVGYATWTNKNNILLDDSSTAFANLYAGGGWTIVGARLVKDGALLGTAVGAGGTPYSPSTLGGSSNLWGATLTPAIVNDASFGVGISYNASDKGGPSGDTNYIVGTGFGFAIPADATINGIEAYFDHDSYAAGGGVSGVEIDVIKVRVYYTWSPKVRAVGEGRGFVYSEVEREEQQKQFRAVVYDPDRNLLGEYKLRNEVSFKQQVNTLHSSMTLDLAQNELSTATALDTIITETGETLTTESDESLLADLAAEVGLGPGSNTEVNNEVDIITYYGAFEELLTEGGEVILTEADEIIMVQDGAPEGRKLFGGYESKWGLEFGDSDAVSVNLLTHSKELDNIILETDDTLAMQNGTLGSNSWGTSGAGPTDIYGLAAVFRYTGTTGAKGRLRFRAWPGWTTDIPVSISIYTGTNPASPGTLLASGSGSIAADPDNFRAATWLDIYFDPATFTNGSDYIIFIDTDYSKTGGNPTYPANFYTTSNAVANSALYYYGGGTGSWVNTGDDLYLELYTLGGSTTRTFNSVDPSNILKQVLDFAKSRGARVSYDNTTIDNTYTVTSITFKTNTISECIDAVLKLCPADWYYYYDYGTDMLHLHQRPTTPAHYYTKGRDTVKLKVERTIEKLINDVIFSGGGDPALLTRIKDQTRINDWRRALSKQTDNRVTDLTTAQILSQGLIDQYGDPLYSATLQVVRVKDFRIEEVTIGELSGFINFGTLIDPLQLQALGITYHPDTLDIDLNALTPAVTKRIEDIKRNLALVEHQNDPTAPS